MGATTFSTISNGTTASKAFWEAVEQANYNHGHSGYTGTIAEKNSFKMIPMPDRVPYKTDLTDASGYKDNLRKAQEIAEDMFDRDDERISDKWGDAGCIEICDSHVALGKKSYLFFGWASE